ncbi:MAG: hypothetical protein WBA93_17985 [Microcoleaceae cyanobacterium]
MLLSIIKVTETEISASKKLEVKSGQFIISRINALDGTFALIIIDRGVENK